MLKCFFQGVSTLPTKLFMEKNIWQVNYTYDYEDAWLNY